MSKAERNTSVSSTAVESLCRCCRQVWISESGAGQSFPLRSVVVMASNGSVLGRAAKRSRNSMMPPQGMMNPMMAGVNPFLAGMFGMNPMAAMNQMSMGEPESEDEQVAASDSASHAPTAGVPAHSPDASLLGGGGGPAPRMPGAEEDYHQVGGSGNQWISRSVTYLKQIPRNKLSELIEQIDGTFDATLTSQLTSYGLLCLIWIYTRIVPTVKISDLRAAAAASVSANPVY